MSTWTKYKLSDICDVRDGTHDSPKPSKSGFPLVTSKHLIDNKIDFSSAYLISAEDFDAVNKRSKVSKFDILFSMIGTVGETALVKEEPVFAIKNVGLIKTKNETLSKFLFYYLISPTGKNTLSSLLSGSTQKFISLGKLRDFPVMLPLEESQNKIASVLSAYDDLIESNEKRIKHLEEVAQLLYTEWFVKPVQNGLPEGWEGVTIGDLLGKVKRKTKIQATEYLQTGEFPIVDQGREFIAGYTDDKEAIYDKDLVVFGDHSRCFKYINFPFACGADGTQLLLTSDSERMPEILLYYVVLNSGLQNFNYARHFKFLKSLRAIKPDSFVAQKFATFADSVYSQIKILRDKNKSLSQTRDLIIPQLVTGKRELK
jgi:type I restriction enzyme S subunit